MVQNEQRTTKINQDTWHYHGIRWMQVIGDSLSFAELMRRDFWGLPMHGFGTDSSQICGALERASWRDARTFHMKIETSNLLTHVDSN